MGKVEECALRLKSYAEKYELDNICSQIDALEKEDGFSVSVAFLGEFSSGKSTLINALVGRKLLPASAKPTTKNIVKVIPRDDAEDLKFFLVTEEGYKEIDALEFQEFALGRKQGNVVVEIPASETLPEGFIFIDTPGVSSLDATDADITFGCLPFIDGAVICQDVNFGGFTSSVIKFLKENLPEELRDKFIFAITKIDTKPKKEVQLIRDNAVEILKKEIGYQDAEDRVALCSPLKFLETGDAKYMSDFNEIFKEMIVNKKGEMVKYRKKAILLDIIDDTINSLVKMKESSTMDLSDIDSEIEEVKRKIDELQEYKRGLEERLILLKARLRDKYERILMSKINDFKNISSEEDLENLLNDIALELQMVTKKSVERLLMSEFSCQEISMPELKQEISSSLQRILSVFETIKTLLRIGIFVLLPGSGVKDVVQAGVGYLVSETIQESEASSSNSKSGRRKSFLKSLGNVLRTLDVPGKAVDFARSYFVESKLQGKLPNIAVDLAEAVVEEIEEILEKDFYRIETDLKTYRESLNKLAKEKTKRIEEFQRFISELDRSIDEIMKLREEVYAV